MIRDIRYGLNLLWKDRGYAGTAILTLAVCIGVNTAVFTIVNSVLLKPLPVPESDRILLMANQYPNAGAGTDFTNSGVPDYYDRLRDLKVFEEQAMYNFTGQAIDVNGSPEIMRGMAATPSLFRLLKVPPAHGRTFDDKEGEIGNEQKILLSYGLWQQLYGGSTDVIGKEMRMGGRPFTIVGVMPKGFHFVDPEMRFWIPLAFTAQQKSDDARHSNSWFNIGRLKPGATIVQAQEQVNAINTANLDRFPQVKQLVINSGFHTRVLPLQDVLVRSVRSMLYLLWGGAAFVLLIGGVNIANLALARSSLRLKELSTRLALGAARSQLARQLILESLIVAVSGGVIGLVAGMGILRGFGTVGLERLPRAAEIQMDFTVIAATLAVSVVVGVLIGLVPVAHLFRINLSTVLHEESRTGTGSRRARAVRRALIMAQVAFTFVLLIGSGLLLASFRNLLAVDPGFKTEGVVTHSLGIPRVRYPDDNDARNFMNRALLTIRNIPGVASAGGTTLVPLSGSHNDSVIIAEGYQMKPGESPVSPMNITITTGYFETMSTALVRGRYFDDRDNETSTPVIIVDQRLAERFWPGQDAIGKRMYRPANPQEVVAPGPNTRWFTVVGVVREVQLEDLAGRPIAGAYYFPAAQAVPRGMTIAIKTTTDPASVLRSVRAELAKLDPAMPFSNVRSMAEYTSLSLMSRRAAMLLATSFAIVSLFLSAIGIYGVLAYLVTQRSREIGIRIALGSTNLGIFKLVVREGFLLVASGFVLGVAVTVALRQVLQRQIYGLGAMDPIVMSFVIALLGIIAVAACALPARRATQVDPVAILNQQ